jgi:hypothetical protein
MAFGDCLQSTQNQPGASAHTISKAFASNVVAGSLLVCAIYAAGNGLTFTVSDNMGVGNVWAQGSYEDQNTDIHAVAVWTAVAQASGACTITGSFTGAADTPDLQICIAEYEGPFASSRLDQAESNQGTGTAVTSGVTPAVRRQTELSVAVVGGSGTGTTCTGTNGYTTRQTGLTGSGNFRMALVEKVYTAATDEAATATLNTSQNWSMAVATYKRDVQFGRPASDVSAGSWGTAPLWSKLNEDPASDAQFITSDLAVFGASSSVAEVKLGSVTDPGVGTGHIVRARMSVGFADGTDVAFITLYQGATLIATSNLTAISSQFFDLSFVLTSIEANSITDYTDLRLDFQYQSSASDATGNSALVSWAALEVPVASGPTITTQPTNQTTHPGSTETFTIAATGSGTLHYQWKLNGSNVGTDSTSYTTGTLALSDNGGQVTCVVTDSAGSATSNVALVNVEALTSMRFVRSPLRW